MNQCRHDRLYGDFSQKQCENEYCNDSVTLGGIAAWQNPCGDLFCTPSGISVAFLRGHVATIIFVGYGRRRRSGDARWKSKRGSAPIGPDLWIREKWEIIMHLTQRQLNQIAYSVNQCALSLGINEFSLLSRIQTGEISAVRARWGEIRVPESELERLAPASLRGPAHEITECPALSDRSLGIESHLGLRRKDVRTTMYEVPGHEGWLSEGEIAGYRAAYSAIAREVARIEDCKQQMQIERQFPKSDEMEIDTSQTGRWDVREALLNLNRSEILLCQRGNQFAVIERFDEESPYAQINGATQILLEGKNSVELKAEFQANARRTLEFMASNATAKAQGIVWGHFHENKPGLVIEAISERCRQAIANQETTSQKITQPVNCDIRV
jgi:hypothetical protein